MKSVKRNIKVEVHGSVVFYIYRATRWLEWEPSYIGHKLDGGTTVGDVLRLPRLDDTALGAIRKDRGDGATIVVVAGSKPETICLFGSKRDLSELASDLHHGGHHEASSAIRESLSEIENG